MYYGLKFRSGGNPHPAREFLIDTFGLFGQKRSGLVDRSERDALVVEVRARESIWAEYAILVEMQISQGVCFAESLSAAWLD